MKEIMTIRDENNQILLKSPQNNVVSNEEFYNELKTIESLKIDKLLKKSRKKEFDRYKTRINEIIASLKNFDYKVELFNYKADKPYAHFYLKNEDKRVMQISRDNLGILIEANGVFKVDSLDENKIFKFLKAKVEKNIINDIQYNYLENAIKYLLLTQICDEKSFKNFVFFHCYSEPNKPEEFIKQYLHLIPLKEEYIPDDIFLDMKKRHFVTQFNEGIDVSDLNNLPYGLDAGFAKVYKKYECGFLLKQIVDENKYMVINQNTFNEIERDNDDMITYDLINVISTAESYQHCLYGNCLVK